MVILIIFILSLFELADMATKQRNPNADGITPIPFDKINPRANEFRRLDTDGNEQISFTEFILGDTHYIERKSAAFHKLDEDGDGVVSRAEYDAFYKRVDDEHRRDEIDRDSFFEALDRARRDHTPFFHSFFPDDRHYMERPEGESHERRERPSKNNSRHNL